MLKKLSKRRQSRKHGFLAKTSSKGGKKVLSRRRNRGRKKLSL